jgi:integrase
MAGNIIRRCNECRKENKTGYDNCSHKGVQYLVTWYEGKARRRKVVPTKKEAELFLHQKVSEELLGMGRLVDISFKDFAEDWFKNYAELRVKPSTLSSYRYVIDIHLNPAFGNLYLRHITASKIDELISRVRKTRKPKTVNNILIQLKSMLTYARRRGYLRENPALDVRSVRLDRREMDFLNPSEIRLLLKHSQEPFKTLFFTAALTGMRRGELLALQWGNIDWNSNTIFVRRSIYWRSKKETQEGRTRFEFTSPKSERSVRAVVMSPALKEALEIHRMTCPVSSHDLVFCTKMGSPIDPSNMVEREFRPALTAAGLRCINFHSLRHSYTAMLISQNENIKFIQSQLGHASIQTTMDRYGHLLPVNQVGVGSKLDAQLLGVSEAVGGLSRAEAGTNGINQEQNETCATANNT